MTALRTSLAIVACLFLITACGGNRTVESDLGIKGAPDWVNEGTQAISDEDGRLIQGVGMAPPLGDESLQVTTADSRARAEIARVISSYVDATLRDYSASSGSRADLAVNNSINTTTQTVLNGAKVKGRWKDPKTGNIYAFAELDLDTLEEAIAAAKSLSTNFKQYFSDNANAGFDRFVKDSAQ